MTNPESFDNNNYYRAGGSLPLGIPSYIKRKADDDLYDGIKSGQFCYALAARQMGKSSLRLRVMARLIKEGFVCSSLDITKIGVDNMSSEEWYYSLLDVIHGDLNLDFDIGDWWEKENKSSPVYRFFKFIKNIVLAEVKDPIVFFLDEIDSMLSLNKDQFSTDDFFASIRAIYNERGDNPEFERINFVILGVATPTDLMNDAARTPFNIGKPIILDNLKFEEANNLMGGLKELPYDPKKLLEEIFYWTNGQPVLTQQVCENLLHAGDTSLPIKLFVKKQIERIFINRSISDNINLLNIQNRIVDNDRWSNRMLQIYEAILTNGKCMEEPGDRAQIYLKLTGLVRSELDYLYVNNIIYETKLNKEWIKNLKQIFIRPYNAALNEWVNSAKSEKKCLKGRSLLEFEEWCNKRDDLTHLEREFLTLSKTIQERRRTQRKMIFLLSIITFVTMVAIYFFFQNILTTKQEEIRAANQSITIQKDSLRTVMDRIESLNEIYKNALSEAKRYQIKADYSNYRSDSLNAIMMINEYSFKSLIKRQSDSIDINRDSLAKQYLRLIELQPKIEVTEYYYTKVLQEIWIKEFDSSELLTIKNDIISLPIGARTDYLLALKHLSFAKTTKNSDANKALWHIMEARKLLENSPIFKKELDSVRQYYLFYDSKHDLKNSIKSLNGSYDSNYTSWKIDHIINDSLLIIQSQSKYNSYSARDKGIFKLCNFKKDTVLFELKNYSYYANTYVSNNTAGKLIHLVDSSNSIILKTFDLINGNKKSTVLNKKRIGISNNVLQNLDELYFMQNDSRLIISLWKESDSKSKYETASALKSLLEIDLKNNNKTEVISYENIKNKVHDKYLNLEKNRQKFKNLKLKFSSISYNNYSNYYTCWYFLVDSASPIKYKEYIFIIDSLDKVNLINEKETSKIINKLDISSYGLILLDSSILIYSRDSVYLEEYNLEGNLINIVNLINGKANFQKNDDQIYICNDFFIKDKNYPLRMSPNVEQIILNQKIIWKKENTIFVNDVSVLERRLNDQIKKYIDPFRKEFEKNPFDKKSDDYKDESY